MGISNKENIVNVKPLVSVLIPTYNVGDFINQAISCIQNQSYSNFEIVVVDDGSSDGTYEILQEIQNADSRLRLFRNDVNSGIVTSLNYGISKFRGEYIMRMDGDDLCHYQKIEVQLDYLIANKNIDLVGCDVYSIDEKNNVLNKIETSHNWDVTKKIIEYTSPVLHIWMCKKELYTKMGGYRHLGGSEDYDFLLRLSAHGFKFTNMPYYGYSVRIRRGNTQYANGLAQRKIVYYIRRLYRERLKSSSRMDSFNENDKQDYLASSKFHKAIHNFSVNWANKAMVYRMKKNYVAFFFSALLSMISPFQLSFFIESNYSKFLIRKYNKHETY